MLEKRVLNLIHAEFDGELRSEERAEFEAILQSSAEARALAAELRSLAGLLDSVPNQEPPAGLTNRILEQVRLPARQAPSAPKFSLANLLASIQPAPAGLAFAAGLALTMGYYELMERGYSAADLTQMVGTMVANPLGDAGRQKDSVTISQPGLSGTISLSEAGSFLVMNFDLESAAQAEIVVGLAEAGLSFGGIAHAPTDSNAVTESYVVSGGALRVVNHGRHVFHVFLPRAAGQADAGAAGRHDDGREISIGISMDGVQAFSAVLRG